MLSSLGWRHRLLVSATLVAGIASLTQCSTGPSEGGSVTIGEGPVGEGDGTVTGENAGNGFIRLNHVGYTRLGPKRAFLMSPDVWTDARIVLPQGDMTATLKVGPEVGSWSTKFRHVYAIDLDAVQVALTGSFSVNEGANSLFSPDMNIRPGNELAGPVLDQVRAFYGVQRDGPDVMGEGFGRMPSHLDDATATVYAPPTFTTMPDGTLVLDQDLTAIGGPVDVAGGWFDAGDYLKLVETTSYAVVPILIALRDHPTGVGTAGFDSEARFSVDWLKKMWSDADRTLYYQVGLGDGRAGITGDHDLWRLPEADDALSVQKGDPEYYIRYRPVFRAGPPGSPVSPNLAGRLAAAFALCSQHYRDNDPEYADECLLAAEHVFSLADTSPSKLVTAAPYEYYPEVEWRDDLELGAAEIALALSQAGITLPPGLPVTDPAFYFQASAHWAKQYITGPNAGADSLNLYDVSALAHAELANASDFTGLEVTRDDLLADLRAQLDAGEARSKKDVFGSAADPANGDVVPHALGFAVTASLYRTLANGKEYIDFGARQLDWVLGANPWGVSFLVLQNEADSPVCIHHQIGNIQSSSFGRLLGAVVAGVAPPSDFTDLGSLIDGQHDCQSTIDYTEFDSTTARFVDDTRAWASVEPTVDYAALAVLALSQLYDTP